MSSIDTIINNIDQVEKLYNDKNLLRKTVHSYVKLKEFQEAYQKGVVIPLDQRLNPEFSEMLHPLFTYAAMSSAGLKKSDIDKLCGNIDYEIPTVEELEAANKVMEPVKGNNLLKKLADSLTKYRACPEDLEFPEFNRSSKEGINPEQVYNGLKAASKDNWKEFLVSEKILGVSASDASGSKGDTVQSITETYRLAIELINLWDARFPGTYFSLPAMLHCINGSGISMSELSHGVDDAAIRRVAAIKALFIARDGEPYKRYYEYGCERISDEDLFFLATRANDFSSSGFSKGHKYISDEQAEEITEKWSSYNRIIRELGKSYVNDQECLEHCKVCVNAYRTLKDAYTVLLADVNSGSSGKTLNVEVGQRDDIGAPIDNGYTNRLRGIYNKVIGILEKANEIWNPGDGKSRTLNYIFNKTKMETSGIIVRYTAERASSLMGKDALEAVYGADSKSDPTVIMLKNSIEGLDIDESYVDNLNADLYATFKDDVDNMTQKQVSRVVDAIDRLEETLSKLDDYLTDKVDKKRKDANGEVDDPVDNPYIQNFKLIYTKMCEVIHLGDIVYDGECTEKDISLKYIYGRVKAAADGVVDRYTEERSAVFVEDETLKAVYGSEWESNSNAGLLQLSRKGLGEDDAYMGNLRDALKAVVTGTEEERKYLKEPIDDSISRVTETMSRLLGTLDTIIRFLGVRADEVRANEGKSADDIAAEKYNQQVYEAQLELYQKAIQISDLGRIALVDPGEGRERTVAAVTKAILDSKDITEKLAHMDYIRERTVALFDNKFLTLFLKADAKRNQTFDEASIERLKKIIRTEPIQEADLNPKFLENSKEAMESFKASTDMCPERFMDDLTKLSESYDSMVEILQKRSEDVLNTEAEKEKETEGEDKEGDLIERLKEAWGGDVSTAIEGIMNSMDRLYENGYTMESPVGIITDKGIMRSFTDGSVHIPADRGKVEDADTDKILGRLKSINGAAVDLFNSVKEELFKDGLNIVTGDAMPDAKFIHENKQAGALMYAHMHIKFMYGHIRFCKGKDSLRSYLTKHNILTPYDLRRGMTKEQGSKFNDSDTKIVKYSTIRGWIVETLENCIYNSFIDANIGEDETDQWNRDEVRRVLGEISSAVKNVIILTEFTRGINASIKVCTDKTDVDVDRIVASISDKLNTGNSNMVHVDKLRDVEEGVFEIRIIFNEKRYSNNDLFAYQMVDKFIEQGIRPSWESVILGRNVDGMVLQYPFGSKDHPLYAVYAGSRAGKGVTCNNLIAAAISDGCPVFYMDSKPDMSPCIGGLAWKEGKEAPVYNGIESSGGVTLEGSPGCPRGPELKKLGNDLIPSGLFEVKENYKILRSIIQYYKGLDLLNSVAEYRSSHKDSSAPYAVMIFDECQNFAEQESSLNGMIELRMKELEKEARSNKKKAADDPRYVYLTKLNSWRNRIAVKFNLGINATFGLARMSIIFIWQSSLFPTASSYRGAYISSMIDAASAKMVKIYGADAAQDHGSRNYGTPSGFTQAKGPKGEKQPSDWYNFYFKERRGYFNITQVVTQCKDKDGVSTIFKPFKIFTGDPDEAMILSVARESGLKKQDLIGVQFNEDGSIKRELGLEGYIDKLLTPYGIKAGDVLQSGYDYFSSVLQAAGLGDDLNRFIYDISTFNYGELSEDEEGNLGGKEGDVRYLRTEQSDGDGDGEEQVPFGYGEPENRGIIKSGGPTRVQYSEGQNGDQGGNATGGRGGNGSPWQPINGSNKFDTKNMQGIANGNGQVQEPIQSGKIYPTNKVKTFDDATRQEYSKVVSMHLSRLGLRKINTAEQTYDSIHGRLVILLSNFTYFVKDMGGRSLGETLKYFLDTSRGNFSEDKLKYCLAYISWVYADPTRYDRFPSGNGKKYIETITKGRSVQEVFAILTGAGAGNQQQAASAGAGQGFAGFGAPAGNEQSNADRPANNGQQAGNAGGQPAGNSGGQPAGNAGGQPAGNGQAATGFSGLGGGQTAGFGAPAGNNVGQSTGNAGGQPQAGSTPQDGVRQHIPATGTPSTGVRESAFKPMGTSGMAASQFQESQYNASNNLDQMIPIGDDDELPGGNGEFGNGLPIETDREDEVIIQENIEATKNIDYDTEKIPDAAVRGQQETSFEAKPMMMEPNNHRIFSLDSDGAHIIPGIATVVTRMQDGTYVEAVKQPMVKAWNGAKHKFFQTRVGTKRYMAKVWDSIMDAMVSMFSNPGVIRRVSVLSGAIYAQNKLVDYYRLLDEDDGTLLIDVVDFRVLFKRAPNISDLMVDSETLQLIIEQYACFDEDYSMLFRKNKNLKNLILVVDGSGTQLGITRNQALNSGISKEASKATAEASYRAQLEAAMAVNNSKLDEKSAGYKNRIYNEAVALKEYNRTRSAEHRKKSIDTLYNQADKLLSDGHGFKSGVKTSKARALMAWYSVLGFPGQVVYKLRRKK